MHTNYGALPNNTMTYMPINQMAIQQMPSSHVQQEMPVEIFFQPYVYAYRTAEEISNYAKTILHPPMPAPAPSPAMLANALTAIHTAQQLHVGAGAGYTVMAMPQATVPRFNQSNVTLSLEQEQFHKFNSNMIQSVPAAETSNRNVNLNRKSKYYKTELCRNFKKYNLCEHGRNCRFAHGKQELRYIEKPYKYKTELCNRIKQIGYCRFGLKCKFIHPEDMKE